MGGIGEGERCRAVPWRALVFLGPRLGAPSFPMAGHLASDFAFSPPPGGGGDGPGGPEPGWVDPRTWMSFQGPPGGSGIGPGVGPGAEVWGLPACPPPYDLCGGMAYCAPQVGVGLVPQGGLETPQPEGEAGAGVESSSEGASPEPCAAPAGAVKLEKEKLEPNPEEASELLGAGGGGQPRRPGAATRREVVACSCPGRRPRRGAGEGGAPGRVCGGCRPP